jgi:hypothetical protein
MEGVILGVVLVVVGALFVAGFVAWVRRAAPAFEDVSITVATGEAPQQIIDRISVAIQEVQGYTASRSDDELAITRTYGPFVQEPAQGIAGAAADALRVSATRLDVGTRVDVAGRAEPQVIHRVLSAVAQSPPWMTARSR